MSERVSEPVGGRLPSNENRKYLNPTSVVTPLISKSCRSRFFVFRGWFSLHSNQSRLTALPKRTPIVIIFFISGLPVNSRCQFESEWGVSLRLSHRGPGSSREAGMLFQPHWSGRKTLLWNWDCCAIEFDYILLIELVIVVEHLMCGRRCSDMLNVTFLTQILVFTFLSCLYAPMWKCCLDL